MMIADSQVHVWAPNSTERPWPARHKGHGPQFSKDELLIAMDGAGVQRAVLVPPSWAGDNNDVVLDAARLHPDRFAVMGRIDLGASPARKAMATWRKQPGMLGLRLTFRREMFRSLAAENRADWLYEDAQKAGVPIMFRVDLSQMDYAEQVATKYPRLKLLMDHLCLPGGAKDEQAFEGVEKLLNLARLPNVAVKASSLPSYTNDRYPYRKLFPYLKQIYDAFGYKRIFWGTDLTRLPCSYRQAVTMFTEEDLPWLTEQDKEWIMGRGLCEWLGWPLS